jgi:hypothetical protein
VVVSTTIPHSDFGDSECCGCLTGIFRGDLADIVCNECDAVILTVLASDLQQTLDEMDLSLDLARVACPHCGAVNLFAGFSEMLAFVCYDCGKRVVLDKRLTIAARAGE